MTPEATTLLLVGLQTAATVVAAIAALAMWRATVNLVKYTRDMVLANVTPEVVIRLQQSPPFKSSAASIVSVMNESGVDLLGVTVDIGPSFQSDDKRDQSRITITHTIPTLPGGRVFNFELWKIAKMAIVHRDQLPDIYLSARTKLTEIEVRVSSRHSATGMRHSFKHCFTVEFREDVLFVYEVVSQPDGTQEMVQTRTVTTIISTT
jgi:hypothetical protein